MSSNGNHLNIRLLDGVQAARDSVPVGLERYYSVLRDLKDAGYTEAVGDIAAMLKTGDPKEVLAAMDFYLEHHRVPELGKGDYHS